MKRKTNASKKIGFILLAAVMAFFFTTNSKVIASSGTAVGNNAAASAGTAAGNIAGSIVTGIASPAIGTVMQLMQTYQQLSATLSTLQALSRGVGIAIADPGKAFQVAADNARHAFQMNMQSLMAQVEAGDRKLAALQQTSTAALAEKGAMQNATYLATTNAQTAKDVLTAENNIQLQNVPVAGCFGYSHAAGWESQKDFAKKKSKEYHDAATDILNRMGSTKYGRVNAQVEFYDELTTQLCNSNLMGGELNCAATFPAQLTKAYAYSEETLPPDQADMINNAQMKLLAINYSTPLSMDPSLLAQPDADTKAAVIRELGAALPANIAMAAISRQMGKTTRAPIPTKSVTLMRDALLHCGKTQPEIDVMLPAGGVSYEQYKIANIHLQNCPLVNMQRMPDPNAIPIIQAQVAQNDLIMQQEILDELEMSNGLAAAQLFHDISERRNQDDASRVF